MKTKFTCPQCQGHILICEATHMATNSNEIVGMDKDESPIYGDENHGGYWESDETVKYACQKCEHEVAGDVAVSEMVAKGVREGWLKKNG